MILIIDNYDSFVYNLVRYVQLCGAQSFVLRNDAISAEECLTLAPSGVIMSPGPKRPLDAGVCLPLLKVLPLTTPFLGVCLGHQCLVEHFDGKTVRAREPLHGQSSLITHSGQGLFVGQPNPLQVGRYHSLISLPAPAAPLYADAFSEQGELMAVRHRHAPWFGVQFHPESVLTPTGIEMIGRFVAQCRNDVS